MTLREYITAVLFCAVVLLESGEPVTNTTSRHSSANRKRVPFPLVRPPPTLFTLSRSCFMKQFEDNSLTLPICKTSMHYGTGKPPVVSYRLGQVDRRITDTLKRRYKGILREAPKGSSQRAGAAQAMGRLSHDNDICCPTQRAVEIAPVTKEDTSGNMRQILRIESEGMFQFYHAGRCLPPNVQTQCQGHCIQETSTVFLLVETFDDESPFSFEPFQVETYCSCKNIGSSFPRNRAAAAVIRVNNTNPTQGRLTTTDQATTTEEVTTSKGISATSNVTTAKMSTADGAVATGNPLLSMRRRDKVPITPKMSTIENLLTRETFTTKETTSVENVAKGEKLETTKSVPTTDSLDGTETTVRDGTETTVRDGTETTVHDGTETTVSDAIETTVRDATETTVRDATETTVRDATETTVRDATGTTVRDATETTVSDATETTVSDTTETAVRDATETTVNVAEIRTAAGETTPHMYPANRDPLETNSRTSG